MKIDFQRLFRLMAYCLIIASTSSCANLSEQWQLKSEQESLRYYTRQSHAADTLPEFKASITVRAPIRKVKELLMDFNRHPQWVHGCEQSEILAVEDYSKAYIYQVTNLPIIKSRDMIMIATTERPDDQRFIVQLQAQPDFCDGKNSSQCLAIEQSNHVHIQRASGQFLVTAIDEETTQVEWTQFLDPAGKLPDWLYRANLANVPIKSLRNLKALLEAP